MIHELHAERDKPIVFAWLRSHLRWHLAAWCRAFGMYWNDADIDRHIDDHSLVLRDWDSLLAARNADDQFVGVSREGRRAVGIVWAKERVDPYLDVRIGVLAWLFVEPLSRGSGMSVLLIDAANQWMARRGVPAAEVFVTAENSAAVNAYRRAGYEMVDQRMIARITARGSKRSE